MASKSGETNSFDDRNDPLDFVTSDIALPLTETITRRKFTITTDSYISLCSRVYTALCAEIPNFTNNVSESAFQYYAVILLWKRFAEILPASVKDNSGFFKNLKKLTNDVRLPLYVPIPLLTYLKGIGNFRDPDGFERQFYLPVFPSSEKINGISYTFGKVNAKTHHFYEAFPAPGIAALRILADIKYTSDTTEKNLLWKLPEGLCPDIQESHVESCKPTRNLLGWAPAKLLDDGHRQLFASINTNENFLQNDYSPSGTTYALFKKIHNLLVHTKGGYFYLMEGIKLYKELPLTGSLVQGMCVEKHLQTFKFDMSTMYCEGSIFVCSQYKLNNDLVKGAVISGYRMAKEPIGDRHCWSCYDFDEYKSVPASWKHSRNTIYTYGSVGKLNETMYTTACIDKRVLQNKCILHSIIRKAKREWNIYL